MRALLYVRGIGAVRCVACDDDFRDFARTALLSYEQLHPTFEQNGDEEFDLKEKIKNLDDATLLSKYVEHLCPSMLAASQLSMREQLHDTIRFVKSGLSTKIAMYCVGDDVTIMITNESGDSEGSLQRDIVMFHRLIGLLYGPCDYLLDTTRAAVKHRLQSELAQIFETYMSMKVRDETFWFDAIESIHLGDDARLQVSDSLKHVRDLLQVNAKVIRSLSSVLTNTSPSESALSHIVLLVNTKISGLIAQPGASDLLKGDLVLLALLAHSAFRQKGSVKSQLTANTEAGKSATTHNPTDARASWHESSSANRRSRPTNELNPRPHSQPPSSRNPIAQRQAQTESTSSLQRSNTAESDWPSAAVEDQEQQTDGDTAEEAEEDDECQVEAKSESSAIEQAQQSTPDHAEKVVAKPSVTAPQKSASELEVEEKSRRLCSFVYRRIVMLQHADCAYVPHEVYFVRVDANVTLVLLFRLPNAAFATSIYTCIKLLSRMQPERVDVPELHNTDDSATSSATDTLMSRTTTFTGSSSSSDGTVTDRQTTSTFLGKSLLTDAKVRKTGAFLGALGEEMKKVAPIISRVSLEERSRLISEFQKSFDSVLTFAQKFDAKRSRQIPELNWTYVVDSKNICQECQSKTVASRWNEVKSEYYQCFDASGKVKDRETLSNHVKSLSESVRFMFQLAFVGDWWRSLHDSLALRIRRSDAFVSLFASVRETVRKDLKLMLDFLHVRAQSNVCVTSYFGRYSGLVFFALVNRTTSQRLSTSLTVESAAENSDEENDAHVQNYVRCTAERKKVIMDATTWYRDMLETSGTQVQFGMVTRHGHKFSFYRFAERSGVHPCEASTERESVLKLAIEDPQWALSQGVHVKEFFTVHLSTVQSAKIVQHMHDFLVKRNTELPLLI